LELFVWCVFFSLLLQRPLRAALLGVGFGSFGMHWAASVVSPQLSILQPQAYVRAVPLQLAIAAVVALVDIWMGARWLREREERPCDAWRLSAGAIPRDMSGVKEAPMHPRATEFGRLAWHPWRQSTGMLAIFGLMILPLTLLCLAALFLPDNYVEWQSFMATGVATGGWAALAIGLTVLAVPLAGASVFQGDWRRGGNRFLAERGVRPSLFWLSRQLVWVVPIFLWVLLVLTLFLLYADPLFRYGREAAHFLHDGNADEYAG